MYLLQEVVNEHVSGNESLPQQTAESGWLLHNNTVSLDECNNSIPVPSLDAPWYKKLLAFGGLGMLISVGWAALLPAFACLLA